MLGLVLIVLLFLLPWWASVALIVGVPLAFLVIVDAMFPPVAAEPFGSAAETKRAAIHFWIAAPIVAAITVALVVAVLRG